MNGNLKTTLMRRIIGLILTVLLLTSLLILTGVTAGAQNRTQRRVVIVRPIRPFRHYDPFFRRDRFDSYRYNQYVFSSSEKAYSQGYKDGLKTGDEDGRKGKSFDPERSHYFQEAGFGNYGEVYRNGFSNGYRAGYSS